MPYDPRLMGRGGGTPPPPAFADPAAQNQWWTHGQAPQGAQFAPAPPPQQPKQWYEGLPGPKSGQASDKADPSKQQLSLLQMLMLGGKPTMSGAPSGSYGAIPGAGGMNWGSTSPWSWLGGLDIGGGKPG